METETIYLFAFFSFRMPIYFTLKVRIIPQIESELKISFETHSWHTKIFHNFFLALNHQSFLGSY